MRKAKTVLFILFACTLFALFYRSQPNSWDTAPLFPPNFAWNAQPIPAKESIILEDIFSKPFQYLDVGGQSYVFASADGRHVLKLFRFDLFRPAWFIPYLPNFGFLGEFRDKHLNKRKRWLHRVYTGHQLAYEFLREESGLLYAQLMPTHQSMPIVIADAHGNKKHFDLGEAVFVIQERGETLSAVFSRILDQGQVDIVQDKISQVLDLYAREYAKEIYDRDHGVMHNIGFVGERPIHLDVGSFIKDPKITDPSVYQQDLLKVADKIRTWTGKHYPQYEETVSLFLEEKLSEVLGKQVTFSLLPT